ncbi:MAG TPA: DapH/DapD/GlmU-related protein [Caulobacteraceae bacterium]|nr:DapH/DapD/GlmU-related protein [Caulobacteraceae bacterium]
MFTATFEVETRVQDEAQLRSLFGTDRVDLNPGAVVTFTGEIVLGPGVTFSGDCRVAGLARIEKGSALTAVHIGAGTVVRPYSILCDLEAGEGNLFGPFCFIRDNCVVGDRCILGAHVETARSRFGDGVKISHRAFVGDAEVGADTIIGAGVVFCNWDGQGRRTTNVGAGVTIGSGSLLVSPVLIGDGAIIAAGSTVTKDVSPGVRLIQKR